MYIYIYIHGLGVLGTLKRTGKKEERERQEAIERMHARFSGWETHVVFYSRKMKEEAEQEKK